MDILGEPWTDVLTAAIALITAPLAVYALFQTRIALKGQTVASDLQTVLSLWAKLDEHWDRFRAAQSEADKNFEFGQLTGYYELACGLFRDEILTTKAARTLDEHLREILPKMLAHRAFKSRFDELRSSPETFANIQWYCARLEAKSPPIDHLFGRDKQATS
jgi:hypothetical protein